MLPNSSPVNVTSYGRFDRSPRDHLNLPCCRHWSGTLHAAQDSAPIARPDRCTSRPAICVTDPVVEIAPADGVEAPWR